MQNKYNLGAEALMQHRHEAGILVDPRNTEQDSGDDGVDLRLLDQPEESKASEEATAVEEKVSA